MKRYLTLALIAITLGITSCCTKKDCPSADEYLEFELFGFEASDFDSAMVYVYMSQSNFTTVVDSFALDIYEDADAYLGYFRGNGITKDYKFAIDSTHIYYINDFNTTDRVCNKCILGDDVVKDLESYKVNGQEFYGMQVEINK